MIVEAIYEPPQRSSKEAFVFERNETADRLNANAEKIAAAFGWQCVGWALTVSREMQGNSIFLKNNFDLIFFHYSLHLLTLFIHMIFHCSQTIFFDNFDFNFDFLKILFLFINMIFFLFSNFFF